MKVTPAVVLTAAVGLLQALGPSRAAGAGPPDLPSPAPTAAAPQASESQTLAEVTVTAKRIELARRVSKFVNQIAAPENGGDGGLARWQAPPVCPLVSGLPQREGEFILERLSEIARAAGVPLADEHCRPNLYILVTRQPEDLLKAMEKRNRPYTFGYDVTYQNETPASVVDEFIKTPRAVRVWYNSTEVDAWGKPLPLCPFYGSTSGNKVPVGYRPCGPGVSGGTHISFNTLWTFSRVFVIVDRTRLQGVRLGQLTDYVAMVAFAKLKPDARLGDAPTILKLFDEAPQAAPPGMTDWDQTFLKSLYATEQKSKTQRGQIARAMVREIVH